LNVLKSISISDKIPCCDNFSWYEVLLLRQWGFYAYPSLEVYHNLIDIMKKLQWIREYFHKPIKITSGWRPGAYNEHIRGAFASAHVTGQAVDFQVPGLDTEDVRTELIPLIGHLQIRMEDHRGSWVHIDSKFRDKESAYFKP
jgi:uncharacterized protein YcbK (DUF882 family)